MHKRSIINGLIKIAEDTAPKKKPGIDFSKIHNYFKQGLQFNTGVPAGMKYLLQNVREAADRVVPFQPIINRAANIYINHIPRPEPATQYRFSLDDIDTPDYPIDRSIVTSNQTPTISKITGFIKLPVNSPTQTGLFIPDGYKSPRGWTQERSRAYSPRQLGQMYAHEKRHKYSLDPRKAALAEKLYGNYGIPYYAEEEPALMSEMLYRSYDGRLRAAMTNRGQRAIYPYVTDYHTVPTENNNTITFFTGESPFSSGYLTDLYPPDDTTKADTNRRFYATPGRYYVNASGQWDDAPFEVADASQLFNGDTEFASLPKNLQNRANNMQDGQQLYYDRIHNEKEWFNLRDQMDVLMRPLAARAPWTQPKECTTNAEGQQIQVGNIDAIDPMPMDLHTVQEKYYLDPSNALPGSSRTIKQMKEDIIPYMQNIYNRQKLIDQNYTPYGANSAGA